MTTDKKFLIFAQRELRKHKHDIIVSVDNGYELFGRYHIYRYKDSFQVFKDRCLIKTFSSLRSASSWCVADKHQQSLLANEIVRLDDRMAVIDQSLLTRKQCRDRTRDPGRQSMLEVKISGRSRERNSVAKQLEKCVWRAKYLQFRGFHNDTQRHNRHYS